MNALTLYSAMQDAANTLKDSNTRVAIVANDRALLHAAKVMLVGIRGPVSQSCCRWSEWLDNGTMAYFVVPGDFLAGLHLDHIFTLGNIEPDERSREWVNCCLRTRLTPGKIGGLYRYE